MVVFKGQEVNLNSIRYPITSQVQPILASKFAEKQTIGDYTKDSDPYSSSWVISDLRGGMLVEEMEESKDANRYHWGNVDTRFNGEITLAPLTTMIAYPAPPSLSPGGISSLNAYWALGSHSATATTWASTWAGRRFTFSAKLASSDTQTATLYIMIVAGGVNFTSTTVAIGETATITATIPSSSTSLTCTVVLGVENGTVSEAAISATNTAIGTTCNNMHEFNAVLYYGIGSYLYKLNGTGDGFSLVYEAPAAITALFSNSTNMFIFLGDSAQYLYMATTELCTPTTNASGLNATKGIYWDSKVFKSDSAGVFYRLDSPATATPSAVASGTLPVADNDLQELRIYHDANGDDIVYAATKVGLYVHDYANGIFLETSLLYPAQSTAGAGMVTWRDSLYVSAGTVVFKYLVTNFAEIGSIGLDNDDGLPALYSGQIVKFVQGQSEFFALVDSTHEGTTSYTQVLSYDGRGWRVYYVDAAVNKNIYGGIVSSVYAYRLWFSTNDGIYWMSIHTHFMKPKKHSAHTYLASGALITPWFDGDWQVGSKNAIRLSVSARDMTTTETIIVKYRINHATTAIGATWTTLGTVNTTGLTSFNFGSSLGVLFRAIQFRFEFARTTTNTLSPVLEYATLAYEKVLPKRWGWQFTVDCSKSYPADGAALSPDQLLDDLITATETELLVPFEFDETTYYVRIASVQGQRLAGEGRQGQYQVTVVEII